MTRPGFMTVAALASALAGCKDRGGTDAAANVDSGAAASCADEPSVTWANWGESFFLSYCLSCHAVESIERFDAPEAVNFDTLADVRTWETRIRVRVLEDATMPVGGGVYEDDLVLLDTFLRCGL